MQALKLLPSTIRRMINEKQETLVLYANTNPLREFHFAKAKDIDLKSVQDEVGYVLPSDTEKILQIHTRDNDGNTELMLTRRMVSPSSGMETSKVAKCSPKILKLADNLERRYGYPLRIIMGKRSNENLFLIHHEPLNLPTLPMLNVLHDLIGRVKTNQRRAVLSRLPTDLSSVQTKFFAGIEKVEPLERGTPVFPGLYSGQSNGIFAKSTTTPADVPLMQNAKVIITGGGTLSHAAIIAASESIPCIVGISEDTISHINSNLSTKNFSFDAYKGNIYKGEFKVIDKSTDYEKLISKIVFHAKKYAAGDVLANADTPEAIRKALEAGASGIGLLRTEHSYKEHTDQVSNYLHAVTSNDPLQRRQVLSKLLNITRDLFDAIFSELDSAYVCVRLLDAPLNEFGSNLSAAEHNPMMGLRGCRFGILYHDFYAMQVQAIAEAYKRQGKGDVGIMIPLVSEVGEVIILRDYIMRIWKACGCDLKSLKFGTMVETPRACLISGELAQFCDFLSYGTNDLTQFTYALSRDDSHYLQRYFEMGALDCNPFVTLDARGVGRLLHLSVSQAKQVNPKIRIGACGQHGGDSASIKIFRELGFDYVSCTVGRVPSAIIAMME